LGAVDVGSIPPNQPHCVVSSENTRPSDCHRRYRAHKTVVWIGGYMMGDQICKHAKHVSCKPINRGH
jgi:hypothetical protein